MSTGASFVLSDALWHTVSRETFAPFNVRLTHAQKNTKVTVITHILSALLVLNACSNEPTTSHEVVDMHQGTATQDMEQSKDLDDTQEPDAHQDAQPDTTDMAQDMADQGNTAVTADTIFAQYATLSTIAGTALISDKGVNGWKPEFEGADATTAELSRPHIALANTAGEVFIADKDAHAIRKVSTDGTISTFAGTDVAGSTSDESTPATSSKLSSPNGLWINSNGTVYVLDLGNDRVVKVDEQGMMTTLFRIGGAGAGRGLWVSDDESLAYISAGTILKTWTPEQGVTTLASGFSSLGNLHVSPSGQLAVTDRGGSKAYLIDKNGEKTHIAGTGSGRDADTGMLALEAGLDEVRGIWFHPQGGYFLATHKGGQIWYVDTQGVLHRFIHGDKDDDHAGDGEPFNSSGKKISEPRAVTMTPSGEVLITEHDGGYIRLVSKK